MNKKSKFVQKTIENIVKKGENVVYQHFLLFLSMFSKATFFNDFSQNTSKTSQTRCVCETKMPPKRPFFEKRNLYI